MEETKHDEKYAFEATMLLAPLRGADLHLALIRWSTLRCDHRLLSASPSGSGDAKPLQSLNAFTPHKWPSPKLVPYIPTV